MAAPIKLHLEHNWPVYVGWSQQLNCRGVFALRDIQPGELVEPCPLILVPFKNETDFANSTPTNSLVDNYYYDWTAEEWCLPLGYAMLYNHSYQPNMKYERDFEQSLLKYVAIKTIHQGDELTVNYNGDPNDQKPIESWFHEYGGRKII